MFATTLHSAISTCCRRRRKEQRLTEDELAEQQGHATDEAAAADAEAEVDPTQLFSASSRRSTGVIAPGSAHSGIAVGAGAAANGAAPDEHALLRERVGIRTFGSAVPPPMSSFETLPTATPWLTSLFRACGGSGDVPLQHPHSALRRNIEAGRWKEPMPIQMQVMPLLVQGRDGLASAPTGSGKTGAFMVPVILAAAACRAGAHALRGSSATPATSHQRTVAALPSEHCPRVLVLAPTMELAGQLAEEGERLAAGTGVRVTRLTRGKVAGAYGAWRPVEQALGIAEDAPVAAPQPLPEGADKAAKAAAYEARVEASYAKTRLPFADIVVTTPQRLLWVLEACPDPVRQAMLGGLVSVVLDECDQLLLNPQLRQQVDGVLGFLPSTDAEGALPTQRVLVSATIPSSVLDLSVALLRDAVSVQIGRQHVTSANVAQRLLFVGREEGKLLEMKQMAARGFKPPVLVFVQSKERVGQLVEELGAIHPASRVAGIHSSMAARKRETAIAEFRAGSVWILVTTELLGRGLDFKGVNTVINYDFPQTGVSYLHRVGRVGRGTRKGTAITFFTEADIPMLRTIANVMRHSGCDIPEWMLQIKQPSRKQRKQRAARPLQRRPISTTLIYERKLAREAKAAAAAAAAAPQAEQEDDGGGWQPAAVHNAEDE